MQEKALELLSTVSIFTKINYQLLARQQSNTDPRHFNENEGGGIRGKIWSRGHTA